MIRRENSSSRRAPTRTPRPRILIVCGAQRTEPDYFTALKGNFRNPAVIVKIIAKPKDPDAVVGYASQIWKESPGDYDEVWCVLDVDHFCFDRAIPAARERKIDLAISNPCFELWLLLHCAQIAAPIPNAQDALFRLCKLVPGYDKSSLSFPDFSSGVRNAIERAKKLDPGSDGWSGNPSTGVWRLVERILPQCVE